MRYLRKLARPLHSDQRGTSTIELAIVLPVLFTIGLGMFEFGYLIYNYHLINVGVRDAARYAAGLPAGSADADAKSIAMKGVRTGGTFRISWWNNPNTVVITNPSVPNTLISGVKSYRGGDNIFMVKVVADVPYQALGFLGYLGLGSITLHAQHEERLYGVR